MNQKSKGSVTRNRSAHVHPSQALDVETKRLNLHMMRMTCALPFQLFIRTSAELPLVAYLVPTVSYMPDPTGSMASDAKWIPDWIVNAKVPRPAIAFKVNGVLDAGSYVCDVPPSFTAGILGAEWVSSWEQPGTIQELWFALLWLTTGIPTTSHVVPWLAVKLKGHPIECEYLDLMTLNDSLTDQQKLFIAICCLSRFWGYSKLPLAECAKHLIQLRLKKKLGVNNFSNYAAGAGWLEMADSQVHRQWEKVLTANRRIEEYKAVLSEKRRRDCAKFVGGNRAYPFLREFLEEMSPR